MGRKSKLTEKQWEEVRQRHINGEPIRKLSKEYGVAESSMREQISGDVKKIKSVADQIVATDIAISELNVSAQHVAFSVAAETINMKRKANSLAAKSLEASDLMMSYVLKQAKLLNQNAPPDDEVKDRINLVYAGARAANESGSMAMTVMKLNQQEPPDDDIDPTPTQITFGVKNAAKNDGNPV